MSMQGMSDTQRWAVGRLEQLFNNSGLLFCPSAKRNEEALGYLANLGMTREDIQPVLAHMDEMSLLVAREGGAGWYHVTSMIEERLTPKIQPKTQAWNRMGRPRLELAAK